MVFSVICLALVPIPLFFDVNDGRFVLEKTSFPSAVSPVPVGLLGMAVALFLYFIGSFMYPMRYKRLVGWTVSLVGVNVLAFLMLWALIISGAGILRVIQVYMPLMLLLFVSYPIDPSERKLVCRTVMTSFALVSVLHFISIVTTSDNWIAATSYEFATFFGYGIYQSLVTYTAVISLYLIPVMGFILIDKMRLTSRLVLISLAVLMLLMLALGARRASLVEFSLILFLLAMFGTTYFMTKAKLTLGALVLLVSIIPVFFFFEAIASLPIIDRGVGSFTSGTFDSGRLAIYERAIRELSSDYTLLLAGRGESSGYHNFGLDLIYTLGVIPLGLFLFITFFIVKKAWEKLRREEGPQSWLGAFLTTSTICLLLVQSMVNASVTQPYYLLNFLMVSLVVRFIPRNSKLDSFARG